MKQNKLQYDDNKSKHHKITSIFFKTFFIYKILNCNDLSGRRDFVESAMKGIKKFDDTYSVLYVLQVSNTVLSTRMWHLWQNNHQMW